MLKIFICEEDQETLAIMKQHIENYILMNNLHMKAFCVGANSAEVLPYLRKNPGCAGLYFISLDTKNKNEGIALAKEVRKYDPRGFLVFTSRDAEPYRHIFKNKVEALDCLQTADPYFIERISECLDQVVERYSAKATFLQDNFVFKLLLDTKVSQNNTLAKGSVVAVATDKILCFMTDPVEKHVVLVHTAEGIFSFRGSLKQIEEEFSGRRNFLRCQNNLVVNLDKILVLDPVRYKLMLENNLTLDIVGRKIKVVAQRIEDYKRQTNLLNAIGVPRQSSDVTVLKLEEPPLTASGEPDIARILKEHGLGHVDLSKAKAIKIEEVKM